MPRSSPYGRFTGVPWLLLWLQMLKVCLTMEQLGWWVWGEVSRGMVVNMSDGERRRERGKRAGLLHVCLDVGQIG